MNKCIFYAVCERSEITMLSNPSLIHEDVDSKDVDSRDQNPLRRTFTMNENSLPAKTASRSTRVSDYRQLNMYLLQTGLN